MDFLKAMHVSAAGLAAQRSRVNAAASNLANAESTRTAEGGPYRRIDPVFEAVALDQGGGVRVAELREATGPGRRVYSPGHPDADPGGFVTLPDVDPVHEVANLMSASRGYEANATALETLKHLALRALDIGR